MEHQQDNAHQAWKSEWPPLSRTARTWVGSLLIGLALFCAVEGYLAAGQHRGLIPEAVSIFVEDGTSAYEYNIALRARTPQHYVVLRRQIREARAPAAYWKAVDVVGILALLTAAPFAGWQGVRFLRAAYPRTWEALARRVGGSPEEQPPR